MFKGINQDVHPRYNTEYYNYALNTVMDKDLPILSTDFSNEFCVDFYADVIGHCIDKDSNYIVFLSNNSIVRFFPDKCEYTVIYRNNELNFGNWIECVYTIHRGCEELVYFTDNKNILRVINLTRVTNNTPVEDFNFNVNLYPAQITTNVVTGGELNAGSYWYTIRTLDDSGTPSNWSTFYNPVYVQADDSRYSNIDKVRTNLAIEFNVLDVPPGYSFQIGIIEYSNLNKAISKVYILSENATYFTGTNYSSISTLNELVVDNLIVEKVNTITEHLNRLFIGNVSNKEYDWAKVQRQANNIKTYYGVVKHAKVDSVRTYRHSDVYDFGIMGTFNNGKTTPVFHIPGRASYLGSPFTSGYDNLVHPTMNTGAILDFDKDLVSNLINGGTSKFRDTCSDCNPIKFDYSISNSVSSNKIAYIINFKIYNSASPNVEVIVRYGGQEQKFTGLKGSDVAINCDFDYQSTDLVYVEFFVTTQEGSICSYVINNKGTRKKAILEVVPSNATPNELPKWQIYNTAIRHKYPLSNYYSSGIFSYYESCERYPDDLDCNGVPIYPHTSTVVNNTTVYKMDRIRYHRFPDQVLEPIQRFDGLYSIEPVIDVDDFVQELTITYPELVEDIKEWKIVFGERNNPIVKDSGIMFNTFANNKISEQGPLSKIGIPEDDILCTFPIGHENDTTITGKFIYGERLNPSWQYRMFFSPKTLIDNSITSGYMYINSYYNNSMPNYSLDTMSAVKTANTGISAVNQVKVDTTYIHNLITGGYPNGINPKTFIPTGVFYSKIKSKAIIAPVKHTQEGDGGEYLGIEQNVDSKGVRNMLYSNNVGVYKFDTTDNHHLPIDRNYYIDIINYNEPYTFTNTIYHEINPDAWIAPFIFSIKVPSFLFDQTQLGKVVTGGLLVISQWINDGLGSNIEREVYSKMLVRMYIEHDYNMEYRFEGQEPWETVCRVQSNKFTSFLNNDKQNIGGEAEEDTIWDYKPDYNKYSKDYSINYSPKPYTKLPINYRYCSECNNEYPNRIYYSEGGAIENSVNNKRTIKVNNYTDLDTPVNLLFKSRDELYARTSKYIYGIPTRPVEISTNQSNVYIGTASLLSIPPKRIASVDYTYGGSEQKLDNIVTEQGAFMITNHIAHIGQAFENIEDGLRNFLRNNLLPFSIVNANNAYKEYKSFYNPNRLYNIVYDYLNSRIFISKKEYVALPNVASKIELIEKQYYYNEGTAKIPIKLTDPKYFIDTSFNVSYNLSSKTFISFHSWIPDYTMFDSRGFYSTLNQKLYKHLSVNHNKSKLTYYDVLYPMHVELALRTKGIEKWSNIVYRQNMSNTEYLDYNVLLLNSKKVINTFTHYVAYNDIQSTGVIPLQLKYSIFDTANLQFSENRFNIALGRENGINKKFLDWNIIEDRMTINSILGSAYNYVDKYFLNNVAASDNSFMNDALLRDDYMNMRFIYDPNFAIDLYNIEDVNNITHNVNIDLAYAITNPSV